jgi:hypothetical protein
MRDDACESEDSRGLWIFGKTDKTAFPSGSIDLMTTREAVTGVIVVVSVYLCAGRVTGQRIHWPAL